MKNKNNTEWLSSIEKNLLKFDMDNNLVGELDRKIRLAKTDDAAITNARIDAIKTKQPFDESKSSKEELSIANQKIVDELITRKVNELLGF